MTLSPIEISVDYRPCPNCVRHSRYPGIPAVTAHEIVEGVSECKICHFRQ